jgi:hypothetical protein
MFRYCLDCDARLPDRYPWNIWHSDGFLCDACDDKRWGIGQDDEDENTEDCE